MQNLNGKVAFITGGASGIGLGIARALGGAGMRLVLADMREDRLETAASMLGAIGIEVAGMKLDVSDRAAMKAAAAASLARFGKIHLVVANAGVGAIGRVRDASFDDWDWTGSVNLGGVINTIQEFLPIVRSQKEGGHILATSSMGGVTPLAHGGVYSVQKAAVMAIMEALYTELAEDGINASVICPGMTRTNIGETVKLRPERYSEHGVTLSPPPPAAASGPGPMALAMDPLELGERVLQGILADDLYILTHNEFAGAINEQFAPILAAMPSEPPPPPQAARAPGIKFSAYERAYAARRAKTS
jgi:NAD(P)-dependent dehydrogenase (short-subunit alcohol dehydrogenase family)